MKTIIALFLVFLSGVSHLRSQDFIKLEQSIVSIDSGASRGVNWIDYDNDNDLDLFITNGKQGGEYNYLYRNDNGTFVKIENDPIVTNFLPYDGSSWADYDNDGNIDMCVVTWYNRVNQLYKNFGDGTFDLVTTGPVTTLTTYSETCSWGDYDNDGLVDLFITNSAGSGHRNLLYKNTGGGNFVRIDTGAIFSQTAFSRGVNWVDVNGDRLPDIFVTRENNQSEFLYKNNGNGYFTEITNSPLTTSGGESWSGSWGDYDNDGDLDVFVTNTGNQRNSLFRNDGDFNFTKILNDPLVDEPGYHSVGGWGDYDNDGDLDMYISQSFKGPPFTEKLVNKLYKNKLMETGSASFEKITSGVLVSDSGYTFGFAWGDYDNDGDLDLAAANTFGENQKNALYRNELNNGNKWINIKCTGTNSNKSGIGAKVKIKATVNGNPVYQMREVSGQEGYCSQNLLLHFGLGNASVIDSMKVEWPSGADQHFTNVSVNQNITITENGTIISVNNNETGVINNFKLFQNYPNPFNPDTRIRFQVSKNSKVLLQIFDTVGNEITTLLNDTRPAGEYDFDFRGNDLSSGVYFYKLTVDGLSDTKSMMLIK